MKFSKNFALSMMTAAVISSFSGGAMAAATKTLDVTFKGELKDAACTIASSGTGVNEVNFGMIDPALITATTTTAVATKTFNMTFTGCAGGNVDIIAVPSDTTTAGSSKYFGIKPATGTSPVVDSMGIALSLGTGINGATVVEPNKVFSGAVTSTTTNLAFTAKIMGIGKAATVTSGAFAPTVTFNFAYR